jgi:hypothetical protein
MSECAIYKCEHHSDCLLLENYVTKENNGGCEKLILLDTFYSKFNALQNDIKKPRIQ